MHTPNKQTGANPSTTLDSVIYLLVTFQATALVVTFFEAAEIIYNFTH